MKVGSDSPGRGTEHDPNTGDGSSRVPDMPLSGPSDLAEYNTDQYVCLRACTCPPGWKHQPGCAEVTG